MAKARRRSAGDSGAEGTRAGEKQGTATLLCPAGLDAWPLRTLAHELSPSLALPGHRKGILVAPHEGGMADPTGQPRMWEEVSVLQDFFKEPFGWAWVSSFLIEFCLCRREQKKYCLTRPRPSPCEVGGRGGGRGATPRRAALQARVNCSAVVTLCARGQPAQDRCPGTIPSAPGQSRDSGRVWGWDGWDHPGERTLEPWRGGV